MEDRLQWIRMQPAAWADWQPLRGGIEAHELLRKRYRGALCRAVEADERRANAVRRELAGPWWRRLGPSATKVGAVADGSVQMLWANMALHMAADPGALIAQWHRALSTDGFLMFSCLGPDTLRELRGVYAKAGWPAPAHDFTDMHDWGDMLVQAGFAEPVMDMERITLTWETPARLLGELRDLGANLHPARFPALRGRGWRASLEHALQGALGGGDGRLALTFEIIYGHAFKPAPRIPVAGESAVSLQDMRALLQSGGGRRT